jgi:hypothetical protein
MLAACKMAVQLGLLDVEEQRPGDLSVLTDDELYELRRLTEKMEVLGGKK